MIPWSFIMILKLLKNGEYRNKDDKESPQYEYYYYDYVPEENAIVIFLETAPESSFTRFNIRADKIDWMYNNLKDDLYSLGFPHEAVHLNKDNNSMLIRRNAILQMLLKRFRDNRAKNEEFNDAMAMVDLLEMLNLTIDTDFLPLFQEIIRDEHKFFGLRSDVDNNIKTYTFHIKKDCPPRLRNNLLRLLSNKIIKLTHGVPNVDENLKFIDDQVGSRVTIKECVFNKLHDLHVEFLNSFVVEQRRFDEQEHLIEDASHANLIFKEKIFDRSPIKYEEKAGHLKLIVDTFKKMSNLNEVIALYQTVKESHDKVDIHRHWFADKIFGKKYTTSWQNAMKEIREHALSLLNKKLGKHYNDVEAKKKIIEEYHKSAIFTDHRSNNLFRFFYKPNIIKRLDMTLDKYNETLRNTIRNE